MRLAMLADMYKPHISGVTNHIALVKRTLEDMGHQVFVFTFGDEDYPDDEPNVIRSAGVPLEVVAQGFHLNLAYSRQARRLLQTMDLVHVHHPFISGRLALRYARPYGIPIVFTNHTRYDLYVQAYLPLLPDGVGKVMLRAYLPAFCRQVDLVIAPSEGVRQVLEEVGVSMHNVVVVPNGVDLRRFLEATPEPWPRQALGLTPDDVVLIYVGRLGPEKNLPFLLRAFRGVAAMYPQVHLVLVGDGPERENLEDRVRDMGLGQRVHFVGKVPYDEVPRYLVMADAFVTASVTEVHPLSVIEAMAAGLPVVGVRSPGVGDMVVHEETGLLVEHDLSAFTAALTRLVSEGEARRRWGEAGREASRRYDVRVTTRQLEEHYRRLVQQARLRPVSWGSRLHGWWRRLWG